MHICTVVMLQIFYIDRIMVSNNIPLAWRSSFHTDVIVQRIFIHIIIVHSILRCIISIPIEYNRTHQQTLFQCHIINGRLQYQATMWVKHLLRHRDTGFQMKIITFDFDVRRFRNHFVLHFGSNRNFVQFDDGIFQYYIQNLLSCHLHCFVFITDTCKLQRAVFLNQDTVTTILVGHFYTFVIDRIQHIYIRNTFSLRVCDMPLHADPLGGYIHTDEHHRHEKYTC